MYFRKGQTLITGILIILLSAVFTPFAYSSAIEDGLLDYRNGHYQKAAKAFSTLSAQENPDVQYSLAMMHLLGKGVEKDPSLGIEWLEIAAGNNSVNAQYELYHLRKTAKNRLISDEKALYWLGKAAENGHPEAMFDMGKKLLAERTDEKNWENAFIWFLRAAETGHATAEDIVGFYYEFGIGVEEDVDRARMYYEKSAGQNNAEGLADLARLYETGKVSRKARTRHMNSLPGHWNRTTLPPSMRMPSITKTEPGFRKVTPRHSTITIKAPRRVMFRPSGKWSGFTKRVFSVKAKIKPRRKCGAIWTNDIPASCRPYSPGFRIMSRVS